MPHNLRMHLKNGTAWVPWLMRYPSREPQNRVAGVYAPTPRNTPHAAPRDASAGLALAVDSWLCFQFEYSHGGAITA
jgi:hypothetical protein